MAASSGFKPTPPSLTPLTSLSAEAVMSKSAPSKKVPLGSSVSSGLISSYTLHGKSGSKIYILLIGLLSSLIKRTLGMAHVPPRSFPVSSQFLRFP